MSLVLERGDRITDEAGIVSVVLAHVAGDLYTLSNGGDRTWTESVTRNGVLRKPFIKAVDFAGVTKAWSKGERWPYDTGEHTQEEAAS